MKTAVVALPGVMDSSIALTVDVLGAANRIRKQQGKSAAFDWQIVSALPGPVETGAGLQLQTHKTMHPRQRFSLVILPGLNFPFPEALLPQLDSALFRGTGAWVKSQHAQGAYVAASCVATFLVADAGLLRGRAATTTWWLAPLLQERHPDVKVNAESMVLTSGRIFTAGAALAQMDLCLTLVTRFCGPRVADLVARYLVIDRRPTQARYALATHLAQRSPEVLKAESWIRTHLHQPFSMPEVARAVGMSARTFARRVQQVTGLSPLHFVRRVRAETAVHLLQTTAMQLDDVASRVGYSDVSTLRRILKRETGQTPGALRSGADGSSS